MEGKVKEKFLELGFEVANHTAAMLAYWDSKQVCRYANTAYLDWFGKTPDEMIGKIKLKDLLGPLYELNYPFIKGALNGNAQLFERDIKDPSGKVRNAIATYTPDIEEGIVLGFFVHVADISTIKFKKLLQTNITPIPHGDQDIQSYPCEILVKVAETLEACLLTEFPGITRLSKLHFISETKLKRDFKNKFNATPFAYYRNLQMELADKYLTGKKYSRKQVAAMLNFANQSNFSVCYKKYTDQKRTLDTIANMEKANEDLYKSFIRQVPYAMAMLDNRLQYLAFSQRWVNDYGLLEEGLIGSDYHSAFPGFKFKWDDFLTGCLNGEVHTCDEDLIDRVFGPPLWIKWEIKPWYTGNRQIGGVLICTDDITALKLIDIENKKTLEILNKTNEIARIGAWKRNFDNGTALWSKVLKEILEVPLDFEPIGEMAFDFYKEGFDRERVKQALSDAKNNGSPFDIEAALVTAKGNLKRVRIIGYPDFSDGICHKVSGIFQEIGQD